MISFSAVFVKLVAVSPTVSAFWRVLFGGLVLALWVRWRKRILIPRGAILVALIAASAFFALDLAFWHTSIIYIGPGLATLLGNFQIFFMAIAGALFFHERLTPRMLIAIPLAILGLVLIVGFDWSTLPRDARLGIGFGLATALVYAGYMLMLRVAQARAKRGRDASADLALVSLITAVILAAYVLSTGGTLAPTSASDMGWLAVYALVSQVFGWVLITSALSHVPAARVGLILLAQPVLSFLWDILFFSRQFTPLEATGAALALVAIYLGSRPKSA